MSGDIFVPQSKVEDALVGPLKVITILTSRLADMQRLLVEGLNLHLTHQSELDVVTSEYMNCTSVDKPMLSIFEQIGKGANIKIRVISTNSEGRRVRPEVNGKFIGGLSVGFPFTESIAHETHLTQLGYPSVVGVKTMEFSGPAGDTYTSEEAHYPGPENIYFLGVKRPKIFVPVGPLDEAINMGGPAYSALCVHDSNATMSFYGDVLGYEIRRDMSFKVDERSGLKLRKGSDERFIQAFAPGSQSGYLVFLDHYDDNETYFQNGNAGAPHQGLIMWSFKTRDLDEVRSRTEITGAKILKDVSEISSPGLGEGQSLIISDPTGFPLEIMECE